MNNQNILESLICMLESKYPSLSLETKFSNEDAGNLREINDVLCSFIDSLLEQGTINLQKAVDAYAQISFEFVLLQQRFYRTGSYTSSLEISNLSLYQDTEEMFDNYLPGLLLTYLFWPNHNLIANILKNEFMKYLEHSLPLRVFEVGVGTGVMPHIMSTQYPLEQYVGIDLSSASIEFAKKSFLSNKNIRNYDFYVGDVNSDLRIPHEPFPVFLLCEILEHVENPGLLLNSVRKFLEPTAFGFITTVCNLEARDHIYLFKEPEQIRLLLNECGYSVVADWCLPIPNSQIPHEINYAAIVKVK